MLPSGAASHTIIFEKKDIQSSFDIRNEPDVFIMDPINQSPLHMAFSGEEDTRLWEFLALVRQVEQQRSSKRTTQH